MCYIGPLTIFTQFYFGWQANCYHIPRWPSMVLDQAYIFRTKITHQRLPSLHDQANNRSQNEKKEKKWKTKQNKKLTIGVIHATR